MASHTLKVIRHDILNALELAKQDRFKDSPNMAEVRELLTDALVETSIEMRKNG